MLISGSRPAVGCNPINATHLNFRFNSKVTIVAQKNRANRLKVRAGLGNQSGDDEPVDIDALAARLAAEAQRLRRMEGSIDQDLPDDPPTFSDTNPLPVGPGTESGFSPFGFDNKAKEADVLANLGDGGFSASEFELLQELGSISVQQVEAPPEDSPLLTSPQRSSARAAVIAYTAMFYSGMPFQDPVVTLMKEYLPGAKAVACNELIVLKHLTGLPDVGSKWKVASAVLSSRPPIVELLGYFLAGPSERAVLLDPTVDAASSGDTIWVVQKWENMAPLVLYPGAQQTSGLGLGRLFGQKEAASRDRCRMLRAITTGALNAVAYCHERSVVHGSLGSGSFLMSTFDDQASARLVIKLDNFGFAKKVLTSNRESPAMYPAPTPLDDTPLALGIKEDLRQLAIVLLECILSALSAQGPTDASSADAVQRVLGEVFTWDVQQYRQYCADDPNWEAAVRLLDGEDGAGWELIDDLVQGRKVARELLQVSKFVHPTQ